MGVGLCLLPCDEALLLLVASAYTSLADLRTYKDSLVSASHLSVGTLGFQVHLVAVSSLWVLKSQTRVLILMQRTLLWELPTQS